MGFRSWRARSKARAEAAVRWHRGSLRTLALRPHAVLGPGDRQLVPRLASLLALPVVPCIGDGENLVHFTSLKTAVQAHVRAAEVLLAGRGHGEAVFVADGPPLPLGEVLKALARQLHGRTPRVVQVPWLLAWRLAQVAELLHAPLPWFPPLINRYRVAMMGRAHWFRLARMSELLALEPGDARAAVSAVVSAPLDAP